MPASDDPFHLQRFLDAQASTYEQARRELAAGQKRSHWMWFIFPQIRGLGSSSTAQRFAVANLAEARGYLAHRILGPRLRHCTSVVNALSGRSVEQIFGYPDDLKFHSSLTLFAKAAQNSEAVLTDDNTVFETALAKYFAGKLDGGTLRQLGADDASRELRR